MNKNMMWHKINPNHDNEEHFIAIIGLKDSKTASVLKTSREIEVADVNATPERFSQKQISVKSLEETQKFNKICNTRCYKKCVKLQRSECHTAWACEHVKGWRCECSVEAAQTVYSLKGSSSLIKTVHWNISATSMKL